MFLSAVSQRNLSTPETVKLKEKNNFSPPEILSNLIGRHSFVTLGKALPFSFKNSSLHYLLQLSYETSNP